jgi:hypothetical protein
MFRYGELERRSIKKILKHFSSFESCLSESADYHTVTACSAPSDHLIRSPLGNWALLSYGSIMTWEEFQRELSETPLSRISGERLGELFAFSLPSTATPEERELYANAKSGMRQEMFRRANEKEMLENSMHRRQDSRKADWLHTEHIGQSARQHTAQMELAHTAFLFHRRSVWIAAVVAVTSALLAWGSLWRQRGETRAAIESVMKRLDDLERSHRESLEPEKHM